MKIGSRRHRLLAQERFAVPDGEGGENEEWIPRGAVLWAGVEPLTGRELMRANQVIADMDTRITVGWNPQTDKIRATWRFVDMKRGTIYNIVRPPINKELANKEIEFIANSGANKG